MHLIWPNTVTPNVGENALKVGAYSRSVVSEKHLRRTGQRGTIGMAEVRAQYVSTMSSLFVQGAKSSELGS